jgi:hypothetical protein
VPPDEVVGVADVELFDRTDVPAAAATSVSTGPVKVWFSAPPPLMNRTVTVRWGNERSSATV